MPERIQRRRNFGWRKPPNTVYVGRPSRWGNPFSVYEHGQRGAVTKFRDWLDGAYADIYPINRQWVLGNIEHLRGKNLSCWCAKGEACHADVLMELANKEKKPAGVSPDGHSLPERD